MSGVSKSVGVMDSVGDDRLQNQPTVKVMHNDDVVAETAKLSVRDTRAKVEVAKAEETKDTTHATDDAVAADDGEKPKAKGMFSRYPCKLSVKVVEAEDLHAGEEHTDLHGYYCKLWLQRRDEPITEPKEEIIKPTTGQFYELRSIYKTETVRPPKRWDVHYSMAEKSPTDLIYHKMLVVEVYHIGKLGTPMFVGMCAIPMVVLGAGKKFANWVPLVPSSRHKHTHKVTGAIKLDLEVYGCKIPVDPKQTALAKQIQASESLYEDPDFPATPESLFMDPSAHAEEVAEIEWRRPAEFATKPVPFARGARRVSMKQLSRPYIRDIKTSVSDVEVDSNSVFRGTSHPAVSMHIASVLIRDCLVLQDPEKGFYQLRIYTDHCESETDGWVSITIDDRIPCSKTTGLPVYARANDPNVLWVPIVEKAFAKLFGTYEDVHNTNLTKSDTAARVLSLYQPPSNTHPEMGNSVRAKDIVFKKEDGITVDDIWDALTNLAGWPAWLGTVENLTEIGHLATGTRLEALLQHEGDEEKAVVELRTVEKNRKLSWVTVRGRLSLFFLRVKTTWKIHQHAIDKTITVQLFCTFQGVGASLAEMRSQDKRSERLDFMNNALEKYLRGAHKDASRKKESDVVLRANFET
eukprot:TRINITY_DN1306_c0_g2_i1.p1 TRINITY_DN1306_c0_g2~~TRINITY_DN1306_c0_g2_i1.p1  ORF type:complete len:655 (+),score=118.15 TRINITY_DN1306_c0_g2_i1:63-1967(+)